MNWLYLAIAIVLETFSTLSLKSSNGFTKPYPTILAICGYIVSFYFLSKTLRTIPIGVAYAIWSGIGITLITWFAYLRYKQSLNIPTLIGIGFILTGVVLVSLYTKRHV